MGRLLLFLLLASEVFSPHPFFLPSLLAAAPVKGNRKQSAEGDILDPPASPKPVGEQNGSQNPIPLEVSRVPLLTPRAFFPATLTRVQPPGEPGHSPSSQEADMFLPWPCPAARGLTCLLCQRVIETKIDLVFVADPFFQVKMTHHPDP